MDSNNPTTPTPAPAPTIEVKCVQHSAEEGGFRPPIVLLASGAVLSDCPDRPRAQKKFIHRGVSFS